MSLVVNHARRHGSRIVHHVAMHRVWGVGRDPERRGGEGGGGGEEEQEKERNRRRRGGGGGEEEEEEESRRRRRAGGGGEQEEAGKRKGEEEISLAGYTTAMLNYSLHVPVGREVGRTRWRVARVHVGWSLLHGGEMVPWVGWWHAGRWVGMTIHHVWGHWLAKLSMLHLAKRGQ